MLRQMGLEGMGTTRTGTPLRLRGLAKLVSTSSQPSPVDLPRNHKLVGGVNLRVVLVFSLTRVRQSVNPFCC